MGGEGIEKTRGGVRRAWLDELLLLTGSAQLGTGRRSSDQGGRID